MTTDFELMVAPNGARKTKADHPALPLTTQELVSTARACRAAGATAMHLHIRDASGRHALDPEHYRATMAAIAAQTDIALQISTEAAGLFDVATQLACIAGARAAEASVALREFERDQGGLDALSRTAQAAGTSLQFILYEAEELRRLLAHFDRRTIARERVRLLFVLGRYGQAFAVPADLDPFLDALGTRKLRWSACAFGPQEQACLLSALRCGGDVRVGFENNTLSPNGARFSSNADAVAQLAEAAAREGFQPAWAA